MDEPPGLQYNRHWRMAVWALRVGYVGLAVALVGIILTSLGSTSWVLAVGVIIWLMTAVATLVGVFRSRSDLPEPRPGYWPMRFMLIHDTVHARPSGERSRRLSRVVDPTGICRHGRASSIRHHRVGGYCCELVASTAEVHQRSCRSRVHT
jgi:hypothetical protein